MVNQRQLNGGKQGSGSGLNADLVDAKNASDLGIDLSSDTILSNDAANTQAAAEARHAAGLAQVNADGGFFDAYVDSSKIDSLTSINQITTNSGSVELSTQTDVSRPADNGSYTTSDYRGVQINPNQDLNIVIARISSNCSNTSEAALLESNGNILDTADLSSKSAGDIFTLKGSMTSGNNYYILLGNKGNDSTLGRYGSPSFPYSGSKIDITKSALQSGGLTDGGSINTFTGSVYSIVEFLYFKTSGTVTHSQFTFTDRTGNAFTPSKIGVFPEYNASGSGEDLTIDLVNSSGTTVKTFQQSDFNTLQSVSVSDDTFHIEVNPSGDESSTPEVDYVDVRGV